MAGNHNDLDRRVLLPDQPHGLKPVHAGHENIEKQQVKIAAFELIQRAPPVAGGDNPMPGPFQQQPDGGLDRSVIVGDEYFCQGRGSLASIASAAGCEPFAELATRRKGRCAHCAARGLIPISAEPPLHAGRAGQSRLRCRAIRRRATATSPNRAAPRSSGGPRSVLKGGLAPYGRPVG